MRTETLPKTLRESRAVAGLTSQFEIARHHNTEAQRLPADPIMAVGCDLRQRREQRPPIQLFIWDITVPWSVSDREGQT